MALPILRNQQMFYVITKNSDKNENRDNINT